MRMPAVPTAAENVKGEAQPRETRRVAAAPPASTAPWPRAVPHTPGIRRVANPLELEGIQRGRELTPSRPIRREGGPIGRPPVNTFPRPRRPSPPKAGRVSNWAPEYPCGLNGSAQRLSELFGW